MMNNLARFGFSFERGGAHTARTMMLTELRDLLIYVNRPKAAENLKKRLELILEGEAPCDIFMSCKTIEKQLVGWEPDLNVGVRLNIRPFMTPGGTLQQETPVQLSWGRVGARI